MYEVLLGERSCWPSVAWKPSIIWKSGNPLYLRLRCERTQVRISPRTVVFIAIANAVYSLGHGLRTLLQYLGRLNLSPSVKWVSACRLSNNNNGDGGCGRQQRTGGLTVQVDWLGLRVGDHPALSLYSSDEPGELSQRLRSWWQHHKNWRGIIIIIVKKLKRDWNGYVSISSSAGKVSRKRMELYGWMSTMTRWIK